MIETTDEFIACEESGNSDEQRRCRVGPVADHIWDDVIENNPDCIVYVVWNKTVPVEVLDRLAAWPDERIRDDVAMKRKLSLKAMEILAKDASRSVRLTLARNPKVADTVLRQLCLDEDDVVSEAAREKLQARGE